MTKERHTDAKVAEEYQRVQLVVLAAINGPVPMITVLCQQTVQPCNGLIPNGLYRAILNLRILQPRIRLIKLGMRIPFPRTIVPRNVLTPLGGVEAAATEFCQPR